MRRFNKTMVMAAMAVGIFAAQGPAQAAPVVGADAILRLIDFRFVDGAGNTVGVGTHISNPVGSNNGNTFAAIDGVSASNGGNSGLGNPLDIAQSGVGAHPGENNFSPFFTPGDQAAFSDTLPQGSAIEGLGALVGATAETRATAGLETGFVGDATSNIGLLVSFDFIATENFTLGFETGYDWTAFAFVDASAAIGTSAQASTSWSITVSETSTGNVVGALSPGELNRTFAALNPGETQGFQNQTGNLSVFLDNPLVEGTRYTLNLRHTTEADVLRVPPTQVPEPGIMALIGLGVLGMSLVARRRMMF